jgi:hypothetical protein
VTEWGDFRRPDFKALKAAMASHVIFDGRNLFDSAEMLSNGFLYHSIGRSVVDGRPKEGGSGCLLSAPCLLYVGGCDDLLSRKLNKIAEAV